MYKSRTDYSLYISYISYNQKSNSIDPKIELNKTK